MSRHLERVWAEVGQEEGWVRGSAQSQGEHEDAGSKTILKETQGGEDRGGRNRSEGQKNGQKTSQREEQREERDNQKAGWSQQACQESRKTQEGHLNSIYLI